MPAYLEGLLAPVADEIEAVSLPVTGELPAELTGRYFRNGPNPLPGQDPGHWFGGDGMIHGVRIRDGHADWYRNRWVKTAKLAGAQYLTDNGLDRTAVNANTNVIRHAGKIFALVESGFPYEMTPELDTVGPCDFGGRLTTAMTAHPKEDPVTGDLHFFGYGFMPPYVTYHRLSATGELVESRDIDVPGATMMHDFSITENYVIWLDLPLAFDFELVGKGMPYQWSDSYGARIGVMPKGGEVQWFDVDPCYVFHVGNAYEDQGRIVLDAVRYSRGKFTELWGQISGETNPAASAVGSGLYRWILDPATGKVVEELRDDRDIEFPSFNEEHLGRPSKFLYTVTDNAIVKYDTDTGRSHVNDLGKSPGEAEFVRKQDAKSEDEGWLMSIVTEQDGGGSELLVLDAQTLGFTASITLPRRVPAGFHGNWLPDA
ncbi:carotenoid oxygenase family protein [Kibdelosporangium philippinense]|uniref:Dioxygenase n=1 Tax=Kibdelosporangium philippinense TaxID=211113 RepID=A0ABS8ZAY0_9PSEU|nr:carotenoid oxygenase family protein [Kibdelosporangium philippinense]MCE7005024.1 carotenoid oxygenase family protein [Kibdelosporangium philippinense]